MKVGLIGSVRSSFLTLKKLYEHSFEIVKVWGYEPESIKNVSGYCNMRSFCFEKDLCYQPILKVTEDVNCSEIKELDILFVVGFSQLIPEAIIQSPRLGCVGFHPTRLPQGRGRAPMAWLVLQQSLDAAATFFKIDEGVDSGDVFVQEPFFKCSTDDVESLEEKLYVAMESALDKWLPKLKEGDFSASTQINEDATYFARRAPLDGFIDWGSTAADIDLLIKASTFPHPGAYSFYRDKKIRILKSTYLGHYPVEGVVGRIIDCVESGIVVQCLNGCVLLHSVIDENGDEVSIPVGARLGYYEQYEIYKLKSEMKLIKEKLDKLYEKIQ